MSLHDAKINVPALFFQNRMAVSFYQQVPTDFAVYHIFQEHINIQQQEIRRSQLFYKL